MIEGRHLVNITVRPALDPILLSLDRLPDSPTETGQASFPRNRAGSPNRFRVHRLTGLAWESFDLAPTSENDSFVQPLPGGRWFLVRSRSDGEQDHNARLYGPDGRPSGSFHAGDGIADVQATDQGHS